MRLTRWGLLIRLRVQVLGWQLRIALYKLSWNRIVVPLTLWLSRRVERRMADGTLPIAGMHPILVIPDYAAPPVEVERDYYHER